MKLSRSPNNPYARAPSHAHPGRPCARPCSGEAQKLRGRGEFSRLLIEKHGAVVPTAITPAVGTRHTYSTSLGTVPVRRDRGGTSCFDIVAAKRPTRPDSVLQARKILAPSPQLRRQGYTSMGFSQDHHVWPAAGDHREAHLRRSLAHAMRPSPLVDKRWTAAGGFVPFTPEEPPSFSVLLRNPCVAASLTQWTTLILLASARRSRCSCFAGRSGIGDLGREGRHEIAALFLDKNIVPT